MPAEPVRVLFVCLGNICRSPVAEAVFRDLVERAGLEDVIEIDSAGTSGWHAGDPPDARSTETAAGRGITLAGASRKLVEDDLHAFHYVIAMDAENLDGIRALQSRAGGPARVHRLREFDPDPDHGDVPDPYYGGPRGFEDVHDIIERAAAGLLAHVRREHGLA